MANNFPARVFLVVDTLVIMIFYLGGRQAFFEEEWLFTIACGIGICFYIRICVKMLKFITLGKEGGEE